MAHIKSCAKKEGYTDETVRIRLEKLIDEGPSVTIVDTSGKGKARDGAPPTLLEDIVAPKKKRKKQDEVITTVLNPADAHQAIMERAKALFGGEEQGVGTTALTRQPQATIVFPPTKIGVPAAGMLGQALVEDRVAPCLPPATQAFKPSGLGGRFAGRSILDVAGDVQMGPPPATQAFRPSNLGSRFAGQSILNNDAGDSDIEMADETGILPPPQLNHNPVSPSSFPPPLSQYPPSLLNRTTHPI